MFTTYQRAAHLVRSLQKDAGFYLGFKSPLLLGSKPILLASVLLVQKQSDSSRHPCALTSHKQSFLAKINFMMSDIFITDTGTNLLVNFIVLRLQVLTILQSFGLRYSLSMPMIPWKTSWVDPALQKSAHEKQSKSNRGIYMISPFRRTSYAHQHNSR